MTNKHLQNLTQAQLIATAIKMRILPSNFLEIRQTAQESDLEQESVNSEIARESALLSDLEYQELVDEVFEQLAEQRLESVHDLASPLLESLHKFELELDCASGLVAPLREDYFADRLGLTKNKLHFILRDMEWAVIFWQLSTDIKNIVLQDEQRLQQRNKHQNYSTAPFRESQEGEESSLSIAVYESPAMPRFGRQSKLSSFRGSYLRDYYQSDGAQEGPETNFYSFSVNSSEYKRYVFLRNDCNYYWAELYHYNNDYQRKVLLARSFIICKPHLLYSAQTSGTSAQAEAVDCADDENTRKLYELSVFVPEGMKIYP